MQKITEILEKKGFTVSVELVPPRNGTSCNDLYSKLSQLKGKVDFVSVTKGAGGSLRGGTLPISYFAESKYGLNTISHFVCRERTKYEIENDLIDLYYMGINNILSLRGDPPADQKSQEWDGDYKHAYLLVSQIRDMNNGVYLPRINVDEKCRHGEKTDFCIIVAGHPEDPEGEELAHMKSKVEAGAHAIITQMIFSFEEYKKYAECLKKHGITLPVIPGIRPLTAYKQAQSVESFFNLKVPEALKEGLKKASSEKEAYEFGLNYTAEQIKKLKKYKAPGVHLFVLNDVDIVQDLLRRI